jgi:hypothetical protein
MSDDQSSTSPLNGGKKISAYKTSTTKKNKQPKEKLKPEN